MGTRRERAEPGVQVVLRNRRLHHDYEALQTFEAGLVLSGSEVKSLRAGNVQLADAHARFDQRGELWLHGLHIGEYREAGAFGHEPTARRKLLLQARELSQLIGKLQTKGLALVVSRLYFRRGWAKCELALVRGRKKADKRAALEERARKRDIERELARRMRQQR